MREKYKSIPRVLHFAPYSDGLIGSIRSMLSLIKALTYRGQTFLFCMNEGILSRHAKHVGAIVGCPFRKAPEDRLKRVVFAEAYLLYMIYKYRIQIMHCHSIGNGYCRYIKRICGTPLVTHLRERFEYKRSHSDIIVSDRIITVTEWAATTLPKGLRDISVALYNPVDIPNCLDTKKPVSRSKTIGIAGICCYQKGFDIFLNACLPLLTKYDIKLEIWGVDDSEYGRNIREMSRHNIDRISIQPYRTDVENFYRSVDIVIMPSRFSEGMGRVAVEAMAWNRPVIAANHSGLAEVVKHGENGLLFESENSNDLQKQLVLLLNDASLQKRLTIQGRAYVEENMSPTVYAERMIEIYNRVISERQ